MFPITLVEARIHRDGLISARFEPEVLQGTIRLFGNGGLFSITGWFRNKSLGVFRAFLTDPNRTVVLRYSDRVVVISPEHPEQFVRTLSETRSIN